MKRAVAASLGLALASTGCAQIRSTSTYSTEAKASPPIVIGKNPGKIIESAGKLSWAQRGATLEVRLVESRTCRAVLHQPVVRVEAVDRKVVGGAQYWEYGLAAATLTVGLIGLIRPELYSPETINENGTVGHDTATGYRIGGIFTALGTGILAVAVYDTVRSRDTEIRTDAYEVSLGDRVDCATPQAPMGGVRVGVRLGDWTAQGTSKADGSLALELPPIAEPETPAEMPSPETPEVAAPDLQANEAGDNPPSDVAAAAPDESPPSAAAPAEPTRVAAKLVVQGHGAIDIEVVQPYDAPEASSNLGDTILGGKR